MNDNGFFCVHLKIHLLFRFSGIQSPPFKTLLSSFADEKGKLYAIMCLGVLLQLSCKTGRLKAVFSLLHWLTQLFRDSETYKQTAGSPEDAADHSTS